MGGVPLGLPVSLPQGTLGSAATRALTPGQTLSGTLQLVQGQPVFAFGKGQRLPLPPAFADAARAGQPVRAAVARSGNSLTLTITPREAPGVPPASLQQPAAPGAQQGPGAPPAALPEIVALLERLAPQLTGSAAGRAALPSLLPPNLPPTEAATRAALAVYLLRGGFAEDAARVSAALGKAASSGVLPQAAVDKVTALLVALGNPGRADFSAALQAWAEQTARSTERRLAAFARAGNPAGLATALFDPASPDIRAMVSRLLYDAGLRQLFESAQEEAMFRGAAERVLERLASSQTQQLRAAETSYLFLNLPAGEAFERAHVHILREGGPSGQAKDGRPTVIAFDLALSRLGELWVMLRASGTQCQCTFEAAHADAADAIASHAEELRAALALTGMQQVAIESRVSASGNLQQAARLLARPQAFEQSI